MRSNKEIRNYSERRSVRIFLRKFEQQRDQIEARPEIIPRDLDIRGYADCFFARRKVPMNRSVSNFPAKIRFTPPLNLRDAREKGSTRWRRTSRNYTREISVFEVTSTAPSRDGKFHWIVRPGRTLRFIDSFRRPRRIPFASTR